MHYFKTQNSSQMYPVNNVFFYSVYLCYKLDSRGNFSSIPGTCKRFLSSPKSLYCLVSIKSHAQSITEVFSPEENRPKVNKSYHLHLVPKVKNEGRDGSTCPIPLLRAQLKLYIHITSTERKGGNRNTRF